MPSQDSHSAAPRSHRGTGLQRPPQPDDETWLSTAELAARLQIPIKTLAAWASARTGPRFARMGRYRRYRLGDVRDWEIQRLQPRGDGP
ncbi:helix-turn-helix domain-containing protein [Nocardia salmonicida]|uniref:helix-turn-helix domain-containing protein n=1 Tax=Nocardia salmonicida TaxID=53431 RepID=UPI0034103C4E